MEEKNKEVLIKEQEDTTYNGWTNRFTWLVALHLSNTQEIDEQVREICLKKHKYKFINDDRLREFVEFLTEMDCKTPKDYLMSDLINHSLAEVNFTEIVNSYREGEQ
jgi:hypothetical protein